MKSKKKRKAKKIGKLFEDRRFFSIIINIIMKNLCHNHISALNINKFII